MTHDLFSAYELVRAGPSLWEGPGGTHRLLRGSYYSPMPFFDPINISILNTGISPILFFAVQILLL